MEKNKLESIKPNLQQIKSTYESSDYIDSEEMDKLLHIDTWKQEKIREIYLLKEKYPDENFYEDQYAGTWTDYNLIRKFGHDLNLGEKDIFYDLGSGYGRVPLYLGANTKALFKG